jgi:secretion/DNA translocation related CpaE-like protein
VHKSGRVRIILSPICNVASMEAYSPETASPAVLTTDPDLLDHVLAVAAVAQVEPHVLADTSSLRAEWSSASMVVVGVDSARRVAALLLPRRTEVYLVGVANAGDELSRWSVQLGAAVVMLPEAATWFATAMAAAAGRSSKGGRLISLVGGTGGVGCSTLAAGLAIVAARAGRRTLLLDCDPLGGGIDLLVGAERIDGWRWPRLASASGELGDVAGQLPQIDGLDLLAMARSSSTLGAAPPGEPGQASMATVLSSVERSHDLVVADLPRGLNEACREVLLRADDVLLVVPATLRGVAASRRLGTDLVRTGADPVVLVRESRASRISPDAVAEGVGLPLLGMISDEPALRISAERGDPPARSSRSPLARRCRTILEQLIPSPAAA